MFASFGAIALVSVMGCSRIESRGLDVTGTWTYDYVPPPKMEVPDPVVPVDKGKTEEPKEGESQEKADEEPEPKQPEAKPPPYWPQFEAFGKKIEFVRARFTADKKFDLDVNGLVFHGSYALIKDRVLLMPARVTQIEPKKLDMDIKDFQVHAKKAYPPDSLVDEILMDPNELTVNRDQSVIRLIPHIRGGIELKRGSAMEKQ